MSTDTPATPRGAALQIPYNAERNSYAPPKAWTPGEPAAPLHALYYAAPVRVLLSTDYTAQTSPAREVWLYPLHAEGGPVTRPTREAPPEVIERELGAKISASACFVDIDDETAHKSGATRSSDEARAALSEALEPFKRLPGFFSYLTARGARAGLIYAAPVALDTHTAALRELMAQLRERLTSALADIAARTGGAPLEIDVDQKCTDLGRGFAAPLIYKRGAPITPDQARLYMHDADTPAQMIEQLAALWAKRLRATADAAGASRYSNSPNTPNRASEPARQGAPQGGRAEARRGQHKTKTYIPADLDGLDNPARYQLTRSAFYALCQLTDHAGLRRDFLQALDKHLMDGRRLQKEGPGWYDRTLQEYAAAVPPRDDAARADEALPEPAQIEGFTELAPLRRTFTRGDDLELAEAVVEAFGDAPRPMWHGNGLRRYDAPRGVWAHYEKRALQRIAMGARGAVITTASGAKDYPVSSARVDAAVKMLAPLCGADTSDSKSAFDLAPRGLALANGFIRATREGLSLEPHAPDNLAIHGLNYSVPDEVARFWATDGDEGRAPQAPRTFTRTYLGRSLAREPEEALGETRESVAAEVAAKITTIGEWLGLALLGLCTREAVALVVHGAGSNGKSVLTNLIADLFGAEQTCHLAPQAMGERFSRAALFGAAVNVVSEMPESDLLAADTLKAVISGDTIEVERKHQDPFSFTPRAAHIFAANRLPASRDRSHGLWRRLVPVEFCHIFTREDRDPGLHEALRAEYADIVLWALELARGYIARGGFTHAGLIDAWRFAWRADTDATAGFLAERLERVEDHKDGATAETLWNAFKVWAEDQGLEGARKTALKTFGAHLRGLPGVSPKHIKINGTTERRYNLRLKDTSTTTTRARASDPWSAGGYT